jgi:hypothetical protein
VRLYCLTPSISGAAQSIRATIRNPIRGLRCMLLLGHAFIGENYLYHFPVALE